MRVLLISGHNNNDYKMVSSEYGEPELGIEVVQKIKRLLEPYMEVTIYPITQTILTDIKNRNAKVDWQYDYVLEICFSIGKGTGTQMYIASHDREIQIEAAILHNLEMFYSNSGIKRRDFITLTTCQKKGIDSAVLALCFLDTEEDMDIYQQCKDKICASIAAGIVEGLHKRKEK